MRKQRTTNITSKTPKLLLRVLGLRENSNLKNLTPASKIDAGQKSKTFPGGSTASYGLFICVIRNLISYEKKFIFL